jgi:hypothetical protein
VSSSAHHERPGSGSTPSLWEIDVALHLTPTASRYNTAIHEAGHAVVAHALGWRVTDLKLEDGDFGGGLVLHRRPDVPRSYELDEQDIMIRLAGYAAVQVLLRGSGLRPKRLGCDVDHREAAHQGHLITGSRSESRALIRDLRLRVRRFLRQTAVWQAVDDLAAKALAHGVLDEPTLAATFGRHPVLRTVRPEPGPRVWVVQRRLWLRLSREPWEDVRQYGTQAGARRAASRLTAGDASRAGDWGSPYNYCVSMRVAR